MTIKFIQEGETHSDETTYYSVKITEQNISLRDFINYLLTKRKDEWGIIKIQKQGCPWYSSTYSLEYKWGKITSDNIPEHIKNKNISLKFSAYGGWSNMNYIFKLNELK